MNIIEKRVKDLKPYEKNPRLNDDAVKYVAESIKEFGFKVPIVIDKDNNIVCGHTRWKACKKLKIETVPCVVADDLTDEQIRAYRLADNKVGEKAEWDLALLDTELAEIETIDMTLLGFDEKNDYLENFNKGKEERQGNLAKKFIVPPFSVLDTRKGEWTERKASWQDLIGDQAQARQNDGAFTTKDMLGGKNNVSVLDPVLCEVVLRWFAPQKAKCFDVFAGDTVFGWVSSYLGHDFVGIELRKEQADFNNDRVKGMTARYVCDDGRNVLQYIDKNSQDFFFSCPPYFDLEVYSDLPNDASNQSTYNQFYNILDCAFTDAIKALKEDRFAVVVCGDVRQKNGAYYNFPNDIKNTFIKNGMWLYNEIILVDPVGTGAVRANNNMRSRKVVKVHQNVLVFYKGNPNKISKVFPLLEFEEENDS